MGILSLIQLIISILSGIVALLSVVAIVIKWLKNGNAKKVQALILTIPELVKQAELMFGSGHGSDKFRWVMTMLKNQALTSNTKVDDEVLANSINDIVDTTNNVNVDKFPFSKETINVENRVEHVPETVESCSNVPEDVQKVGD